MSSVPTSTDHGHRYRHEAFFYADDDEFFDGTLAFLREAVASREPTLVVLSARKNEILQRRFNPDSDEVLFADMAEVGSNPARIIPAWHDFLARYSGPSRRLRGIGEPIWAGRSEAETAECQRHEALLNVAFADPSFWLLCPYDTSALPESVIDEARRTHPFVSHAHGSAPSATYPGGDAFAVPSDEPLSQPTSAAVLSFGDRQLRDVRRFVADQCVIAGVRGARSDEAVLAVNELATNSLLYGGGSGTLRVWTEAGVLIFEVQDRGCIGDPLVGRQRPALNSPGGRGLWIVNQVCDLVQVRQFGLVNVVRVHIRIDS